MLLHVAAPTTALVVQSWWHVKVAGVNAPSVHVSTVEAEIVKPALHVGTQVVPCGMLALLHVVALATACVMQSNLQHITPPLPTSFTTSFFS